MTQCCSNTRDSSLLSSRKHSLHTAIMALLAPSRLLDDVEEGLNGMRAACSVLDAGAA